MEESVGAARGPLAGPGGKGGERAHAHLNLSSCFCGGAAWAAEAREGRSRLCMRSKDMDSLRRSLRGVTGSLWDWEVRGRLRAAPPSRLASA